MNCKKYKEMITEQFGSDFLSNELQTHIGTCEGCAELLNQLKDIESSISDETIFALDPAELDKAVANVDRKLDTIEEEKVTVLSPLWKSFVPAAAAILLIVGLGSMTNLFNFGESDTVVDSTQLNNNLTVANAVVAYDLDAYGEMLDDYLGESSMASADILLNNITDEELEYLEQNFDVGDIL